MIRELLDKRASAFSQMKELQKRSKDRKMTDDEQRQWDAWDTEVEDLTKQIDAYEEKRNRVDYLDTLIGKNPIKNEPLAKKPEYRDMFAKYVNVGLQNMTSEERAILNMRGNDLANVESRGTNTQITTTTTLGGFLVPEDWADSIIIHMAHFGPLISLGSQIKTQGGGTFNWPTIDDTGTSGLIQTTEGGTLTVQDLTIGEKTLSAYTYYRLVKVSLQLLQDNIYNLPEVIWRLAGEALGRKLNTDMTTGDGSTKCTGIVTGATTVNAQDDVTITYLDFLNLEAGVDYAYLNANADNVGYMFNQSTLKSLKALTIGSSDDRSLWQPSIRVGEPSTVNGYRYWINSAMASIAASAKPILFGDFSGYAVRQAGGMNMMRLNERFADALSVGFILWSRYDGKIVNADKIRALVNLAS